MRISRREARLRSTRRWGIAALALFALAFFMLFVGGYASDEKLGHVAVLSAWAGCFFSFVGGCLCLAWGNDA